MKKKLITTIDLWNQYEEPEDMLMPALGDEFDLNKPLYNTIQVI